MAIIITAMIFIQLISTLSYAVRIVGVRTKKIAISISLFNIIVLFSRTANGIMAPFLSNRVDIAIQSQNQSGIVSDLRIILLASTVATILGVILIPSFQRIFTKIVSSYSRNRSYLRLISKAGSRGGVIEIIDSFSIPAISNFRSIKQLKSHWLPLLMNSLVVGILLAGTLSSIYAGILVPDLRLTASSLHSIINGSATILLFLFVDPYLATMTDDVISQSTSENEFRSTVVLFAGTRIIGTVIAQIILVPAAIVISKVASII